jgi:DnaJ-class molecular chaperone
MEQYEQNWKNYYQQLQVDPNAEQSIITAAYKRLALIYHPDTNKKLTAHSNMADINEAYEVLSDPIKRRKYDLEFAKRYSTQTEEQVPPSNEEIIRNLITFAAEEVAKGKKSSEITDEITRMGIPFDVSTQIVKQVFEYRSRVKSRAGGKQIGCGLLMLIVGGIITGITYASAKEGGSYIVTTGLLVVGAINLIVGLFRWFTS